MPEPETSPDASEIRWTIAPQAGPVVSLTQLSGPARAVDLALADAVAALVQLEGRLAAAEALTAQSRALLSIALTRLYHSQERWAGDLGGGDGE